MAIPYFQILIEFVCLEICFGFKSRTSERFCCFSMLTRRAGTSLIIAGFELHPDLGFGLGSVKLELKKFRLSSLDISKLITLIIILNQVLSIELYRVVQRLEPG